MAAASFPQTEAWKHSVERLAKHQEDSAEGFCEHFQSLFREVLEEYSKKTDVSTEKLTNGPTTKEKYATQLKGFADMGLEEGEQLFLVAVAQFVSEQLTYFVVSPPQVTADLLAPFGGEPTLGEELVTAIRSVWSELGKQACATARKRCVSLVCGPQSCQYLSAVPHLRMFKGDVQEVECDDGSGEVEVSVSSAGPAHKPFAMVQLPASSNSHSGGKNSNSNSGEVQLSLNLKNAYEFFCELEAIQAKLDELANQ